MLAYCEQYISIDYFTCYQVIVVNFVDPLKYCASTYCRISFQKSHVDYRFRLFKRLLPYLLYKISYLETMKLVLKNIFRLCEFRANFFFILLLIILFNFSLCESHVFWKWFFNREGWAKMVPRGLKVTREGCTLKSNSESSPWLRSLSSVWWSQKFIFSMCLEVCRYACRNMYYLCTVKLLVLLLKKI